MDFTTGTPSEEALASLIKSLVEFLVEESLTAPLDEVKAVSE